MPKNSIRLSWQARNVWHPVLLSDVNITAEEIVVTLHRELAKMTGHPSLAVDDNLKLSSAQFRRYAETAVVHAHASHDRIHADFAAAFGCECVFDVDTGLIADTALRTMSGAGHQHFLKTMRDVIEDTSIAQLNEALFGPWRYRDLKLSLRFDPSDDRRYALRWSEPSGDPAMTVRGANRLAIEGIPLLPCMPVASRLETTGFAGTGARNTFWTWPIWSGAIELDSIRSVLALRELQADEAKMNRENLRQRGILECFRSQRLTIGKFRNFAPARSV